MASARMAGLLVLAICVSAGSAGCADGESDGELPVAGTRALPLTDARRLAPAISPLSEPKYPALTDPSVRRTLLLKGYGDWDEAPGEACVNYPERGEAPVRGKHARRLVRFAHLGDINIVDDESPGRAVNTDQATALSSPFRPQETELCRMANAMVRTLNGVHAQSPLAFVLLGGNVIDNAQQNELDWALQILGGAARVECDSGEDDDLVPNVEDGKDPFVAPGLAVPFYWVTGNHDVLIQGVMPVLDAYRDLSVGDSPLRGFELRDFSEPAGLPGVGPVPADERRRFLSRQDLLRRVHDHDDGHGLSDEQLDSGKAFYRFDVPDTPLRFIVLDTAAETGSAEGVLRRGDIAQYVRPALDEARAANKWVILAAHHPVASLGDGRGYFGNVQDDAVTPDEWLSVVGDYPNVLFSLAAHERADHVQERRPKDGHAFWELTSAALGDYPHQARIIEIWDEDNGYVSLQAIYVDMDMQGDPVAEQGRHLGVMDYVSGWNPQFSSGLTEQRNVRVFAEKP